MTGPTTTEASVSPDRYDEMLRLADLFEAMGEDLRARARLGVEVLGDEDVSDSEALSRATFATAADDIRAATTGKHGALNRSIELDADALVVRATVLTYRWIDELQNAAYRTLGSIAGRAIGYLAPEVALGGAIVSAGLIETDAVDRDGVSSYLSALAENNPDLLEHLTAGGGGLVESLQLRSMLTAGVLGGEAGSLAAAGGLRALGTQSFPADTAAAVRDIAGSLVQPEPAVPDAPDATASALPRGLAGLLTTLAGTTSGIGVHRISEGRYIGYLPGPDGGGAARLRLVGGDLSSYSRRVRAALTRAIDPDARVMLVGSGPGGLVAAELAAARPSTHFTIEQVVTAGSPSAQAPRLPESVRMLSLEDRTDPVALLGSLMSAEVANRLTVVFEGGDGEDEDPYLAGARAADAAPHPELRAALDRLVELGYLAVPS
ncbi:hypothetical protein [Nocardioides cynanchi]|uniref:hypothetical protein n=1 Tax=Nocardioides cynanchi TaxID=2558918 RepID=UPI0012445789|nr:hypothetical protein [Nocardioides cynanchi]